MWFFGIRTVRPVVNHVGDGWVLFVVVQDCLERFHDWPVESAGLLDEDSKDAIKPGGLSGGQPVRGFVE